MPLTVQQKINIGRLSGLYASNEIASGQKRGGLIDPRLPNLIYAVTQALVWMDELDSETVDLDIVGNHLISICRHQLKAQGVLAISSGGEVAPISGNVNSLDDLDFQVSASSPMVTGATQIYLNGENGLPDYRGLNVTFSRNELFQHRAASEYTWNKGTGLFSVNPAAGVGEFFKIMPDNTGNAGSSSVTDSFDQFILSANGTYTLLEGYQIWKIDINPTVADNVKIGTTASGDEIMLQRTLTAGSFSANGVLASLYADSGSKTVYFTGFTATATINIYILPI